MTAKKKLFKDLALVLLGYLIMRILVAVTGGASSTDLVMCWMCAGVAIGWGLASHIITAVGPLGLLIKFLLALVIGLPATPIILIKDIIGVITEYKDASTETM